MLSLHSQTAQHEIVFSTFSRKNKLNITRCKSAPIVAQTHNEL